MYSSEAPAPAPDPRTRTHIYLYFIKRTYYYEYFIASSNPRPLAPPRVPTRWLFSVSRSATRRDGGNILRSLHYRNDLFIIDIVSRTTFLRHAQELHELPVANIGFIAVLVLLFRVTDCCLQYSRTGKMTAQWLKPENRMPVELYFVCNAFASYRVLGKQRDRKIGNY